MRTFKKKLKRMSCRLRGCVPRIVFSEASVQMLGMKFNFLSLIKTFCLDVYKGKYWSLCINKRISILGYMKNFDSRDELVWQSLETKRVYI